jgi:hypothetical protein
VLAGTACGRRVCETACARIEATALGLDIRFVVTNLTQGSAERIYDGIYCARSQAENLIKMHKSQLTADRPSCRSPIANQVRLVLHTAAYWLMLTVRDTIPKAHALATAEFATLRLPQADTASTHIGVPISMRRPVSVNAPVSALRLRIATTSLFWLATSRCRPEGVMAKLRGVCPPLGVQPAGDKPPLCWFTAKATMES